MRPLDWTKVSSVAEIASSIAVVATLIYLTIQIQQNTAAIEASSRHTILETDVQLLDIGIAYPAIARSMYKQELLTDDEKLQLEWWLIGLGRSREYQWLQYQNGVLDQQTWESNLSALALNLSYPRTRAWWKLVARDYFDHEFVAEVDRYLAGIPVVENYVSPLTRVEVAD